MGDLHCLRVLDLLCMETSAEDVHVFGKLPSLIWLNFRTKQITGEQAVFGKGVFPVLECFALWPTKGDTTAFLLFEQGAMPKLRKLWLQVNEWGGSTPVGMEHLILLEEIGLNVPSDVFSAFIEASQLHPNRPCVVDW
uniref:Uncharacterized protein n=1 Tax=Avena sativa TaxID=4498 RepID=A0ACD5W3D4_AVESA